VLAHLSIVPGWILRTEMSDKTIHYLGYLLLTYLWWFSWSPRPGRKLQFGLITLIILAFYAAIDEYLQAFVRRSPDIHDFIADMSGVLTVLSLVFFLGFRTVSVIVLSLIIVVLTSLSKYDPLGMFPAIDIGFYFFVYFLIAWLCVSLAISSKWNKLISLCIAGMFPIMVVVLSFYWAHHAHKSIETSRIAAAYSGIFASWLFLFLFRKKLNFVMLK
jgi:hypothetical protein